MPENFTFEVSDHIATLTLNRPAKLNAFTNEMLEALVASIDDCQDNEDIRVVILTGTGRGFSTGGDVTSMGGEVDNRPHTTKDRIYGGVQAFPKRLARFDKPIIAAVNGLAVGGGMDLALACDFRTAGQSARFAETYAKIGLAPGGGGAYFLPRLVGMGRALELLWTAEFIDADTAKEIGLVNHVFPNEMLMEETLKIAQRIASMPPLSIRLIKRAAYQSASTDMETALDLISSHIAVARAGADHPEAIAAFKEKRAGSYVGY